LDKEEKQPKLGASSQNTIGASFAAGQANKAELSPAEIEQCKRAQVLLSACGGLALSVGENHWFKYYVHAVSKGQVIPLSHNTVMERVSSIVGREIEPTVRDELRKVRVLTRFRNVHSLYVAGSRFRCYDGCLVFAAHSGLSRHYSSLHF